MEKFIYLILAHKNPKQLYRLIHKLNDECSHFYVHLDKKTNIDSFSKLIDLNNVNFIKERIECIWGDISLVFASLNLIEAALKNHAMGMCILLSGQDYPIKDKEKIQMYLERNINKTFIDNRIASELWDSFKKRSEYYRFNISSKKGDFVLLKGLNKKSVYHLLKRNITFFDFLRIQKKRKLNIDMEFCGGSQWWAMNINMLNKIYTFVNDNKSNLFKYFQHSHCSDEFFFHSIINHLSKVDTSIKIEKSICYANWSRKKANERPVTFRTEDLDELFRQPDYKLFARKFDIEMDEKILDLIDELIH
ncbi:MAG: hypothetical protein EA359_16910 [Balneolaceae bacterium]|nr:MAG: hypothetical protein EA359_16910 [Balneolaceae bacterium]